MANSPQAKKRARTQVKRNLNNSSHRSAFRTAIKKVLAAIEQGDKDTAAKLYREAASVADRLVGKGLAHQNKASRHKSRLNARIKAMG